MTINASTESNRFRKRSIVCAVGVVILFFILLLRLLYLQVTQHRFYATLSERNVINIIPVKPPRGIIYDRNGVVLAKNIPVYSLMITPGRVKNMKATLEALKPIVDLSDDEIKTFKRVQNQYYPYQDIPLKRQLTEAEVDHFYVDQYRFKGVSVQTNMIRNYPLANATSDVVGYVGRITARELAQVDPSNYTPSDDIGKSGVESEDEELLHGTMGSEQAEIDANGKVVRILKINPPVAGDNLYLTIDSKLQAEAETLMGDKVGALVAIQPSTGQVLALVTKPNYDPNVFSGHMTSAQYHAIMDAPDHPMFNRATRATYAPGSTVKPFIAFGALNEGVIDSKDYIMDPGWFRLPNTKHIFHNWVRTGFGWVNVTKAIMVSCDTFFYQLATVLGIDRLDQILTQFGFGQLTGINLPSERPGVVPSPAWKEKHIGQKWYEGDTVVAGIGQGYLLATPIQLATATAIMAERGLKFQPTVLLKLQQPNGITTTMQPIAQQPIVTNDPKAWDTVIQGMQQVIANRQGTAYSSFAGATYTAAGKTGTAQVNGIIENSLKNTTLNNHLFICFAPVDNPQIAIAVVVEHISGMDQSAVKVTRQLLDFYFKELKDQVATPAPAPTAPQFSPMPAAPGTPVVTPVPVATPIPSPSLPAPQSGNSPSPAASVLPAPESAQDIQKALQDDLQQEMRLQKAKKQSNDDADADTDDTGSAQLEQQMEAPVNSQMDMQTQADQNSATQAEQAPPGENPATTGFQKKETNPNTNPLPAPTSGNSNATASH